VLVADDNEVNQMLAVRLLEKRGIEPRIATNGREAVEALTRDHFDLVLMDCQMPELDGYGATHEIRRVEGEERHTPIVAMTAHSMRGDRDRCLAAGMDDYLSKPLDTRAFDLALSLWLGEPDASEARDVDPGPSAEAGEGVRRSEGAVDPTAIERLREQIGSVAALERIVGLFETQTPVKMTELRASIDSSDLDAVRKAAHFLKGSAASLGAIRMAALCSELECASLTHGPELLEALEDAFNESVPTLRREAALVQPGAPANP